jgi:hypothetical protein
MSDEKGATRKWLVGQELIDAVDPILQTKGWTALNIHTSRGLCEFNAEGRCIGFTCLQLFPHVGPQWVADDYRGTGISESLAEEMWNYLQEVNCRGFLVVADSPHSEKLCKAKKMTLVTSPVYKAG